MPAGFLPETDARMGRADRIVGSVCGGEERAVFKSRAFGHSRKIRQERGAGRPEVARTEGVVAIPKSVRKERIAENFDVFSFSLDDSDMSAIAALDTGKSCFLDHRDPATVKWLSGIRYDI